MQLVKDNRLLTFDEFKMLCRDMYNFREGYKIGYEEGFKKGYKIGLKKAYTKVLDEDVIPYLIENNIITPEQVPELKDFVLSQLHELK